MVDMRHIGKAIDVERLKDEIRKLNPADKNEICKWIDQEAAIGLLFRAGVAGEILTEYRPPES